MFAIGRASKIQNSVAISITYVLEFLKTRSPVLEFTEENQTSSVSNVYRLNLDLSLLIFKITEILTSSLPRAQKVQNPEKKWLLSPVKNRIR